MAAAQDTRASLKSHALRVLAQREHSRAELARKLAQRARRTAAALEESHDVAAEGCSPDDIEAVLDELTAKGFLSDARAAESWVAVKSKRSGVRQLRYSLQARGLQPDAVQGAIEQVVGTEFERARALWLRKFGVPAADATQRARQARFLMARGFEPETVRRVLREATEPEPPPELPPEWLP